MANDIRRAISTIATSHGHAPSGKLITHSSPLANARSAAAQRLTGIEERLHWQRLSLPTLSRLGYVLRPSASFTSSSASSQMQESMVDDCWQPVYWLRMADWPFMPARQT